MKTDKSALIVDDALFMREIIHDSLDSLFTSIYEESSYDSAWKTIINKKPFLVTLDLNLDPLISLEGLKLVKKIFLNNYKSNVIIISAIDQCKITESAQSFGIKAYLPKPFDKKKLQSIARDLLEDNI